MDLIAFTRDQDMWVMTTRGVETQLTFCSRNKKKADISCGIAEFVMQEEFHRFTNYYWAPNTRESSGASRRKHHPSTEAHSFAWFIRPRKKSVRCSRLRGNARKGGQGPSRR